jgi:hypothetical protein
VIAAFSLMHIHHWSKVTQQIMRFLVKGGVFIYPKALGDEVIWERGIQRYRQKTHAERVFLDVVYRSPEANDFARRAKGITAGQPGPIAKLLDRLVSAGYLRGIHGTPSYCYSMQPIPTDVYVNLLQTRGFGLFRKFEAAIGTTSYESIVDEASHMEVATGAFDYLNLDLHWDIYQMRVDPLMASFLVEDRCHIPDFGKRNALFENGPS